MEVKVDKIVHEKVSINITGVTLLSVGEAEKLPYYLRKYDRWYWLRLPGLCQRKAAIVNCNGSVNWIGSYVSCDGGYVRPALTLSNLESSDFQVGDRFEFGGVEFEVVSNDTAFCIADLGRCAFREDYMATDANDYEVSDIKKFVDNWFTNAACAADI